MELDRVGNTTFPDIEFSLFVVPYNATVVIATTPEASKIILEWTSNVTNLYQGFLISYVNNKTNETFNVTVNKFVSSYELNNLTGYSHYFINFAVYTLAGIGKWTEVVLETMEDGRWIVVYHRRGGLQQPVVVYV
jgi:hypothetical protein